MTQEVSGTDYSAALRRFDEDKEHRDESVAEVKRFRNKLSRRRRVAGWIGLSATLLLVAGIAVPNVMAAIPHERPYAVGPVGEDEEAGLDDCVGGLWEVRREMDLWLYKHGGKLPPGLDALDGAPKECPGCGGAWTYRRGEARTYRIACPKPEAHGRAAVFLDHIVGPPRIRLDAASEDLK